MSKISVLMPVYNGEKYLKQAINSVLNQSFKDFEFIIVDDGSKDGSENIIKSFNDKRIRYYKKKHSGIANTLNFGIEKSKGEYIARMDADDICEKDRFKIQIDYLTKNSEIALLSSWASLINENNKVIGTYDYTPLSWKIIKLKSFFHNPFIHSTIILKKEILQKVDGYKNFKYGEDYELWTRIIYKYPCVNLPLKLIKYRVHLKQFTITKKNKMRLWGFIIRLLILFRFRF